MPLPGSVESFPLASQWVHNLILPLLLFLNGNYKSLDTVRWKDVFRSNMNDVGMHHYYQYLEIIHCRRKAQTFGVPITFILNILSLAKNKNILQSWILYLYFAEPYNQVRNLTFLIYCSRRKYFFTFPYFFTNSCMTCLKGVWPNPCLCAHIFTRLHWKISGKVI